MPNVHQLCLDRKLQQLPIVIFFAIFSTYVFTIRFQELSLLSVKQVDYLLKELLQRQPYHLMDVIEI